MMKDVEPDTEQDLIKVVYELVRKVAEIEKLLKPEANATKFIYKENTDDRD